MRDMPPMVVADCIPFIRYHCYSPSFRPIFPSNFFRSLGTQRKPIAGNNGAGKLGRRATLQRTALLGIFLGGSKVCGVALASQTKYTHLSIEEIKSIIENDIRKGQYYVTGNMTREIYENNCRFKDPTTDLIGLEKYISAVKFLFDPDYSKHELLSIAVIDPHTIEAKWRLEGYLKFPWTPHIAPYEGSTRYMIDDKGLITSHEETWDISVWTALQEFILPSRKPV